MSAAVQTLWAELIAGTLADAGVKVVVISPGSRSTPLVTALAALKQRENPFDLVTIIDERAAAFYALGVARATGVPAALLCTSGTAAAHYLPALVEASAANVPMIAITADRPPELLDCGASQTIDQVRMYGAFVRGAFDLGAPVASVGALRAVRRKVIQALTLSRGPIAGPVQIEVPLRKPLEPAAPSTEEEHALAKLASSLRGAISIAAPTLLADDDALAELAAAIASEPDGVIIAGSMPASFAAARDTALVLAERAGYPLLAEMTSQLRVAVDSVTIVSHLDLVPVAQRPTPRLIVQIGAEPVAASWPAWSSALENVPRWVLAEAWADPTSSARVILGDPAASLATLQAKLAADRSAPAHTFASDVARRPSQQRIRTSAWLDTWRSLDVRAKKALDQALAAHPHSETAIVQAAVTAAYQSGALLQVGNSLPIRILDQVAMAAPRRGGITISQRGAAGIDGLIASAAGATRARRPVLLILGDVSFAHDLAGLLAAQSSAAYLAILVIDNHGGQIFAGLPVARSEVAATTLERHWLTPPGIDPLRVAQSLGARTAIVGSPEAAAQEIKLALEPPPGSPRSPVTVIHAPVSPSGAHDVRRTALELFT